LQRECDRCTPVLKHVRTVRQHEGRRLDYDTVEGDRELVEYNNKISAGLKIHADEIATLWPHQYVAKAKEMAEQAARQQMRQFFSTVDENCKKAGTSMDAGGQP